MKIGGMEKGLEWKKEHRKSWSRAEGKTKTKGGVGVSE